MRRRKDTVRPLGNVVPLSGRGGAHATLDRK
jgi:hypothetical protein